jgi:hypothetical protein
MLLGPELCAGEGATVPKSRRQVRAQQSDRATKPVNEADGGADEWGCCSSTIKEVLERWLWLQVWRKRDELRRRKRRTGPLSQTG